MEAQDKHICPSCGYEYESWVEVCPDCNVPITNRPARLEVIKGSLDDSDPQWTVVTNVPNAIIGNLLKGQLENAGIPVLLMRSTSADIGEFTHNDYVPHDIRVPRSHLREARELIDSPADPGFAGGDWDDEYGSDYSDGEAERERGWNTAATSGNNLPEGWSLLPGLPTLHQDAPQEGSEEHGWGASEAQAEQSQADQWQTLYNRSLAEGSAFRAGDREPAYRRRGPSEQYDYDSYARPSGLAKWARWIYALLLLAMSMPFILQLLAQAWNFGRMP